MMKTHIEHQDRSERKAHGLRFGRLWALAGFVVLLCLIQGLIGIAQVATSVEITFSPSSPVVGQLVTVTWKLTADTSSATFSDSLTRCVKSPGSSSCDELSGTVAPGSASASGASWLEWTYSFTPSAVGTYTVQGSYPDCAGCAPELAASSASETLYVGKADTTTAVSLAPTSSVTGQNVTLTATVAAVTSGTPTGTVTFYANGSPIPGTGTYPNPATLTSGQAVVVVPFNAEDSTVTITATYAGDGNYNGSTGSDSLTVNKAGTATSVSSDKASAVTGETVTLTAAVTATSPGSGTPTGTVEFFRDTTTSLGTAAIDGSGDAVLSTSFAYSDGSSVPISATYSSDGNYNGSSGTLASPIAVAKASTTVAITSDAPDPSLVGQPYTVSGTVSVDSPGGGTPTGTVTVGDGSVTSAAGTVGVDGSWSCSLTSTTAGSKTITATYSGDTDYSPPATAPTTTHTVNPSATTTTVSSLSNPSVTGQSVTLTATVSAVSPGTGTPTGTVTFYTGSVGSGNEIGSPTARTLTTGQATVSTTFNASDDPVTIIAVYNADSNYNTSESSAFTQNVNKANTTTTITGTNLSTPTVVGVSYTVNGTVTVNSPGALPLTAGTVTVSDGTDSYTATTFSVSTGVWSHSFVSTTAGIKTITATYSGDTDFQPSSGTDSHTVNKASTKVAITSNLSADTVVGESYTVTGKVTPANTTGTHTTSGTVQVSDGMDTCTDTTLAWNAGGWWDWSCDLVSTTEGAKTITATYFGDANYEDDTTLAGDAAGEQPVAHTVNQASTTVTITSALTTPTVVGESYTVSGKLTPANTTGTHINSGSVEVSDTTDTCTDTTLTWNSSGWWDWSCNLISTTAGSKTITAEYSGDTNYSGDKTLAGDSVGERPVAHTVNQASTTVTITGAALGTATDVGESYTVSGRVTPANTTGTHTNTGTVKVSDGTVADDVIDIPLTWSVDHWEWSCSFVSTTAGAKTITAIFDPTETSTPPGADPNYATSQGTESHTVNQANTTTTVTVKTGSNNPSVTGEAVTFTATVAAVSPGSGTPADGTAVSFVVKDNGTNTVSSGEQSLLSGTADYTVATGTLVASKSPYTITATFDPSDTDPNYDTSASSAFTQNVNQASTTTAITGTSLGTPTVVGVSYTVNGNVAVVPPGTLPLTGGTVTVSDGTDSDTATAFALSTGVWSHSFISTTAGSKTITATYSDLDTDYNGSTDTASHDVTKGTVTVGITQNLDPWTTGVSDDFTATVAAATGSGTPSGTVTFQIKDKYYVTIADSGPHTLSSGNATSDAVTLTADQSEVHVTATYSGDANFSAYSDTANVTVYPTGFEITGDDPDPSLTTEAYTVTWAFASGVDPSGKTVDIDDGDAVQTVDATDYSVTMPARGSASETRTITASYSDGPTTVTEQHDVLVLVRDTDTAVSGPSAPACVSQPVLLTATVTDESAPPDGPGFTGTITWTTNNGSGTFDPVVCNISQGGQCSTYYTPVASDVGTVNIAAAYSGDDAYDNSTSSAFALQVGKRSTGTTVFGSDTPLVVGDTATFLVTVSDTSSCVPIVPTGSVSVTVSPSGEGILIGGSHTLIASEGGQFTFTYTPISKASMPTPHTFTATYTGSGTHNGSFGEFDQAIIGRAADVQMSVAPTTAYVYQPVTIAINVADDTTAGIPLVPTGTVTLAVDDGSGTFDHSSYTLDGNGNCTAVYVPDPLFDDGTDDYTNPLKTITATYSGSDLHAGVSTVGHLNVALRPTTTTVKFATSEGILVNEHTTFTVTVADAAGVAGTVPAPDGTIYKTKSLEPKSEGVIGYNFKATLSGGRTRWTYSYYRTALDAEGGDNDTITATYTPNDGIHTGSNGPYGKSISRRPTVTTISNAVATATGITYDVEVVEDSSNNGTPVAITSVGDFIEKGGTSLTETKVGDAPGPVNITKTLPVDEQGHTLMVNVTVHYEPNDRVHLTSLDSETVDRSEFIEEEDPTDPSNDGSGCTDGCGDGGTNVDQIIFNMNAAVVALQATQMGLDAGTIIASLFPNPVVTVGIIFESGAEIPAKDIVIAVLDGANLLLEVAIMAMETDLDGDGLPDTVENTITNTEYNNPDSDGDGMGDYDEISYCGGYYGGTLRPNPNISDSDSDGLMDGYELAPFYTDVCVTDTDCDTLPDGVEVACRTAPTADNGFDTAKFTALGYSYTFPTDFADERDQPNPREADTDGDGLRDDTEFGPGDLAASAADSTYSPYVNDADSDGDGILDGNESTNGDAVWDYTQIGGTGTTGSGETHLCLADTDGDGLLDGEEEALFGRDGIEVHSTLGTITTPALDDDSDDDGLSDYEEQVVTGTDPLNWDSDDDGISDADELIATSGTWPARSFYQSSDPLDPDTDDDGLTDYIEYGNNGVGTGLGTLYARLPSVASPAAPKGDPDNDCPLVNDDDSDDDGLQDGTESWDGDDTITTGTIGNSLLQADTPGDAYSHTKTGETDFCNPDTDGDGLTDGEEVALLGGLPVDGAQVGGTTGFAPVTPKGVSTDFGEEGLNLDPTIPALDDDSDNDGLSDYEEVNITGTDPLDQDSDNDTLSDANELIATGGTWPNRTFIQESDPLDPDTDDDDLYDQIEYPGSGLGTLRSAPGGTPDTICPIVNDDDSDDDGLQDGYEDKNHDGIWNNYVLGNSGSAGSGETNPCDPDTDRDGLSDGEEEGLIARTATPQGVSASFGVDGAEGAATVPALDDDSDNDGLSDYEEVNATMTDPLDADSDDDTLSDANELIATGWLSLSLGYTLNFDPREFQQESDPLDPDTDDDDLFDYIEYPGSGLGTSRTTGGNRDNDCPYVNDADSDDDGLQDGTEDANHDGTWGVLGSGITVGSFASQAARGATDMYWETDLCNPDTDGDGLLDGEEVALIGGGPTMTSRTGTNGDVPVRAEWGFDPLTPQAVSTELPSGTSAVPSGYAHTPDPSPGTQGSFIAPYVFDLQDDGDSMTVTIPALDVDSDNDGLSDYEEVNITGTDPLDQDSDNDTLMDSDELIATGGTAGATPRRTFDQESDPLDINTDDDGLFDPQEYHDANAGRYGSGLSLLAGAIGGVRDLNCPFVNDDDSDDDGIQDGAVITIDPALTVTGTLTLPGAYDYSYTHYEDFIDVDGSSLPFPGEARPNVGLFDGEQRDDSTWNVCDPDSDGDGLNDGEEVAIGTNPDDCDTDDDARNDWHEVTGGGPIPTDPFDPDTDDDGLLDSAEVFGSNPTNPVNADTDGDGLCDGGTRTPWMTDDPLDPRVVVNPICKSCSIPGTTICATPLSRLGSPDGIGDHPNPIGIGEDEDGWGDWDIGVETDPNQYDTDGDALADGIERLSFSTTRQQMIPTVDLFGRPITVVYPEANNTQQDCGCLNPLDPDSDDDGLSDGYEDANHDGNFDFLPSDFEYEQVPLPGPPQPNPNETNPCDPDTDHDELTDWEERVQRQPFAAYFDPLPIDNDGDGAFDEDPVDGIDNDLDGEIDEDPTEEPIELTFNPTNPLDHDTDNDRIYDGPEVKWVCTALTCSQLDNDTDALINEDPVDGIDNDEDGLLDEDPVDFTIRFVPMLDPTNRDSDSDGYLDGLDDDPCNSECIPTVLPPTIIPVDTDGDGFSDDSELAAGTHPNDPEDHPIPFCNVDMDFDQWIDDRVWLEPSICCGIANSVVIDIDSNVLIDFRLQIVQPRDIEWGDFDEDGAEDDVRYIVEYAFANYRVLQPRIVATIDDYNADLVIDWVVVERK